MTLLAAALTLALAGMLAVALDHDHAAAVLWAVAIAGLLTVALAGVDA